MSNINNLTLGEIKELITLFQGKDENTKTHYKIGEKYFIRTVTMYHVGELKSITSSELLLTKASWVCDAGRMYDTLKTGNFNELEPFLDDVIVNRDSIIDATIWRHDLPTEQK